MRLKDFLLLSDKDLNEIDTGSVGNGLYDVTPETNGLKLSSKKKKKKKQVRRLKPFKNPVSMLNPGDIVDESKLKLYRCYIKYFNATVAEGDVVVAPSAQDAADYGTDIAVNKLFKGHTTPEAFDAYYREHPGEFEIEEVSGDQVGEINRRALLREGGHVFSGQTSEIDTPNVLPTIESLFAAAFPALRISDSNVRLVGSALRYSSKPCSDIDVAVERHLFALPGKDAPKVEENLAAKLSTICRDVKILPGLGIVSCCGPISGPSQAGDYVQVDGILTDNLDGAAFKNYCPAEGASNYPASYRNILLASIVKGVFYKPTSGEKDQVLTWQRGLLTNNGVYIKGESLVGQNQKLRRTPKTTFTALITRDVAEFLSLVFDPYVEASQLNSFESIMGLLTSKKFSKLTQFSTKILEDAKQGIQNIGGEFPTNGRTEKPKYVVESSVETTCACLIKVGKEFLVCHPTGASWKKDWSLPKGVKDAGETDEEAARREVFEETGIKLTGKLKFLGHGKYRPGKDITIFETELPSKPTNLVCSSYFKNWEGKSTKEVDKYAWITYEKAEEYLNKRLFDNFKLFVKEF